MYIIYFLMWIIFNANITVEITIFGLVIAALVYAFTCAFLDFSIKKDLLLVRRTLQILWYGIVLVWEIVKANAVVIRMILSPSFHNEPVVIKFKTNLHTKAARALLANSITLTPGTITVTLNEDEYTVHCLDKSLAKGIDTSVFVSLLQKMEKGI